MERGIKIVVVGPQKSGKSGLVSFLAGVSDSPTGLAMEPTIALRILETERKGIPIELWDTSGDQSFENTWPAVQKDADGIMLVYNPEIPGAGREIELWHEWFVSRNNITPERVVCICLGKPSANVKGNNASNAMANFGIIHEVFEPANDNGTALKSFFEHYVGSLIKYTARSRRQ